MRQALQHREYKTHNDIQNALVPEGMTTVDYQPVMAQPDLSQLSPFLREYILAVAVESNLLTQPMVFLKC